MKKAFSIIVMSTLALISQAQIKTYKQMLHNNINVINATAANAIIKVVEDTANYVACTNANPQEALVKVDSNTLSTTSAANDKVIIIGTTERNHFIFNIENGAMVIYDGKTYTANGSRTINKSDNGSSTPATERDWTGSKKYDVSDRLHWTFYLGSNTIGHDGSGIGISRMASNEFIKLGGFCSNARWNTSYSFYMDDHFGLGLGIEAYNFDQYTFNTNYVEEGSADQSTLLSFSAPQIENSERWKSYFNKFAIGIPIHFIYYPSQDKHSLNMELELIPKFNIASTYTNQYTYTDESGFLNVTENRTLSHPMPVRLLEFDMRLSAEIGLFGLYFETGLRPMGCYTLDKTLADKNGGDDFLRAFHMAFGIKLDLFNLGKD